MLFGDHCIKKKGFTLSSFEEFYKLLSTDGIDIDAIELAETLWLSQYISKTSPSANMNTKDTLPTKEENHTSADNEHREDSSSAKQSEYQSKKDASIHPVGDRNSNGSLPFRAPLVRKLYKDNDLIHAFRHFRQKVVSRKRLKLDEDKIADYLVRTDIFRPFYKKSYEKKFSVLLIVDISDSMQIWESEIEEFIKDVKKYHIFKNVIVYYMDTNEDEPKFFTNKEKSLKLKSEWYKYTELNILCFIFSDMVSKSWSRGNLFGEFLQWQQYFPFAIVQMLPQRLWNGTKLIDASIGKMSSRKKFSHNPQIYSRVEEILAFEEDVLPELLKIPILSFNESSIDTYGRVINSLVNNKIDGALFEREDFEGEYQYLKFDDEVRAENRLKIFYKYASKTSKELLELLAMTPLTFPIIRLIQQNLLPHSTHEHLSEILTSDMIVKNQKLEGFYQFYKSANEKDGVREELIKKIGAKKAFQTIVELSNVLKQHSGVFDFMAYVVDPTTLKESSEFNEIDREFARISVAVLSEMGGKYKDLADKLQKDCQKIVQTYSIGYTEFATFPKHTHHGEFSELEKAVIQKLYNAGWDNDAIIINEKYNGIDILLKYMNKIIAAIELKTHEFHLHNALQRSIYYANEFNISFAFATNGKTIYEYNLITSEKSIINIFPSPDSLQLRMIDSLQASSIQKENLIIKEDDNTNDTTSEISFECEECGLKHSRTCSELDWEDVGGSERNMGSETEYEAEYTETCAQCGNDMSITFRCSEYPAGVENYRDTSAKGIVNLQGNCCLELNTPDEEPTEDDPYSNIRRENEIKIMDKDWLESIVDKNTSYASLEEKIDELTTFIDNLTPYAELEFTYNAEDYSNEEDVPEDQILISREFDQKYLHALIEEIQEDIDEITSYLHYSREEVSIRNNLLSKKQYLIESDKIYESYGVDIECNIYPEDNEQILYIYPINNIQSGIDLLESDEEDYDLSEAESGMMQWFFEHYDDPANFLPYETKEGGYQYLFGGPYELDQIFYDEFGDIYPNSNIENVIKNIEQEYGDMTWAKKPNDEMYDYGDSENMNVSEQIEKEEEFDKTYTVFIPANGKIYKFEVSTQYYLIDIIQRSENKGSEFPALYEMIKKTNATDQGTINFKINVEGNIPELNKLILNAHSIYGEEKGISFYSQYDIKDNIDQLSQKLNDSAIHAQINGNFSGWDGKSLIRLTNGEIWMQTEYYYQYSFAFMPKVTLISTPVGYKMKVDGINKEVAVKRLEKTIESSIVGSFNGWNGDTVVELINGEKWAQSTYKYSYSYAYDPTVLIYNDGMGFKMKVDGNSETVDVKRLI